MSGTVKDSFTVAKGWRKRGGGAERKQEPVAVIGSNFQLLYCRNDWSKGLKVGDKLYTTPPQRKPLDMTEIVQLTYDIDEDKPATMAELFRFARAIEAAHGIKE